VTRRSRWYTEKAWAHLLYLTSSHTSIYVKNRERRRTIRTHSLLSIRAKHRTTAIARLYQQSIQRLRDTSQEQNRVIQYNYTLSPHRARLSFITYFFAQWMTIIEQENTVFGITITSITNAKESSFVFATEDRKPEHRCIEYRQWRAEQRRCVTTNSTGTRKSLLERHALNRSYRFIIWYIASKLTVSAARSRRVVGERFSPPEGFVRSIHIA